MLFVLFVLTFVLSLLITLVASRYRKCAPNQALIISGLNSPNLEKGFRVVIGNGALVLPFIQQHAYLSLELMPLKLESAIPMLTRDGVPLSVEAVAQVRIPAKENAIAIAAQLFLTKTTEQIKSLAAERLNGNLRSVIGKLESEDAQFNYKLIGERVQAESALDFERMGLAVISVSVKSLTPVAVNDSLSIRVATVETTSSL